MTDDRIKELAIALADEETGCTEDECRYVEFERNAFYAAMQRFARAIEAECRGVPDYVWMIGTKGFMALFATEEAANDWQQMNGTNTPASYIQPVSIPVLAAAPKPEPERKHETVPTLAEPECECGAVASEHCPACEPVAQEPEYWAYVVNGSHTCFSATEPPEDAYDEGTLRPLYLAPPDHSAEVPMTPAASIFKDEVARLNAEVERLRERAKRIEGFWAAKCATIEAEVESLRLALETENGAATLYAKQVAHWICKHDAARERIAELERQQKVLVEALEEAKASFVWIGD